MSVRDFIDEDQRSPLTPRRERVDVPARGKLLRIAMIMAGIVVVLAAIAFGLAALLAE